MKTVHLIAGGAVLAALAYVLLNGRNAGAAMGGAVVDLADGIIGGVVVGAGQVVGVPPTNLSECERAKAEGRTWDASFACPAGNFLKYVFS